MTHYVVLDVNAVCRFCLEAKENLSTIFQENKESLVKKVLDISGVQIVDEAYLPRQMCEQCCQKIQLFHEFKTMIIQSQCTLIETGAIILQKTDDDCEEETNNLGVKDQSGGGYKETSTEQYSPQMVLQTQYDVLPNEDVQQVCDLENGPSETNEVEAESYKTPNVKYPSTLKALKNNQCLLCLEQCADLQALHKHVDAHVSGTLLDPYYIVNDKQILCRACEKNFKYRFNYLEHQRQHLNIKPFVCTHEGCQLSFYSNSSLKQHLPLHAGKDYICATCGQGFKRKSELSCHEIIHQDEGKLYTCSECFKQFKNRITLKAHSKIHVIQPKHKCSHCYKEYYSRSELYRHMFRHNQEKTFSCKTCGRAYYSKSALNRHLREMCNTNQNLIEFTNSIKTIE